MGSLFLVSTTRYLLVGDGQRFYRVHTGAGLYYGLARAGNKLYVACRHSTEGPRDETIRAQEKGSILVFDAETLALLEELQPESFPLRDVHGIACLFGALWVTCSYDNLVALFSVRSRKWGKWYPSPDLAARDRDVHHFNTVELFGSEVCLVSHNNGPSQILLFDPGSLQPCRSINLGRQAHDVFSVDGDLATCSSGEGLLVSDKGWSLRTGGFPRGVAHVEDSVWVGISQVAPRVLRDHTSGIIRRFDPQWTFQGDCVLKEVGMILAILPIDLSVSRVQSLPVFSDVEWSQDAYNSTEPGNVYWPGRESGLGAIPLVDWHAAETTHRWTAMREARMMVVINPGETKMRVEAYSGYPGPYSLDLLVNRQPIGALNWPSQGEAASEFKLPQNARGQCELTFRVPELWVPKPESLAPDCRLLGASIRSITISSGLAGG